MSPAASSSAQIPPSSSAGDSPSTPPTAALDDLVVDRAGAERESPDLLARLAADPRSLVLAVRRDAAPVIGGRLALVPFSALAAETGAIPGEPQTPAAPGTPARPGASASPAGTGGSPSLADPGTSASPAAPADPLSSAAPAAPGIPTLPDILEWAFLGRTADGRGVLLAVLADGAGDELVPDADWAPLRAAGGDLPAGEAQLLTTAVALAGWLRDAPFCPACGARTVLRHAGWSRHCPSCGREHFPRTDPAVIVLLTSADRRRVLLGANAAWGGQRYSCFAGFGEAGESLEDTVEREVHEESGVRLRDIEYRGSQAWPYPRSLMLGFRAVVVDDDEALADGEEIVEVRWFTRDEIGAAMRGEGPAQLPGAASIAHRLIDDWYRETA